MVAFHPAAARDADIARAWYERERPGLGNGFSDALIKAVEHISDLPLSFPLYIDTVRRARIHGFPYHVYFEHASSTSIVVAVAHMHRNPDIIDVLVSSRKSSK